jgi:hypothetical protein
LPSGNSAEKAQNPESLKEINELPVLYR